MTNEKGSKGSTVVVGLDVRAVILDSELTIKAPRGITCACGIDAYLCDVGSIIVEINETIKGLRRWARPERHYSGLMCFPSVLTKVYKMPYGVTLIISPFNFPILLTLGVLLASIAGGNTAVIKTGSKSKACTGALKKFIEETFDEEYVTLIDGGHDIADLCLAERFDKIFYTGSPSVAKHVMTEASRKP